MKVGNVQHSLMSGGRAMENLNKIYPFDSVCTFEENMIHHCFADMYHLHIL